MNFILSKWNYQVDLEENTFYTKCKIEESMLIVMNKHTQEESLSQPLQNKYHQFKLADTFLTCYKVIFNLTNENNKFMFKSVYKGTEYKVMTIFLRSFWNGIIKSKN